VYTQIFICYHYIKMNYIVYFMLSSIDKISIYRMPKERYPFNKRVSYFTPYRFRIQ